MSEGDNGYITWKSRLCLNSSQGGKDETRELDIDQRSLQNEGHLEIRHGGYIGNRRFRKAERSE